MGTKIQEPYEMRKYNRFFDYLNFVGVLSKFNFFKTFQLLLIKLALKRILWFMLRMCSEIVLNL